MKLKSFFASLLFCWMASAAVPASQPYVNWLNGYGTNETFLWTASPIFITQYSPTVTNGANVF